MLVVKRKAGAGRRWRASSRSTAGRHCSRLDRIPIGIYVYLRPVPTKGARSRALERGDSRSGGGGDAPSPLRDQAGDTRQGWCGGHGGWHVPFAMAAQAVWSRCASRASRDMAAGAFAASYGERTGQLPKRWVGFRSERTAREILKGQPSGGHAEQASNTARGTPEVPVDLRRYRPTRRQHRAERPNRPARDRAALVPRGTEARGSGGGGPRRSARPLFSERNGI